MNHIDISKKNEVKAVSTGSGMVTATTWQPNKGRQEAEDMARAKQRAFEEMMEAERKANDPVEKRFMSIEKQLSELQEQLITFNELLGQK